MKIIRILIISTISTIAIIWLRSSQSELAFIKSEVQSANMKIVEKEDEIIDPVKEKIEKEDSPVNPEPLLNKKNPPYTHKSAITSYWIDYIKTNTDHVAAITKEEYQKLVDSKKWKQKKPIFDIEDEETK